MHLAFPGAVVDRRRFRDPVKPDVEVDNIFLDYTRRPSQVATVFERLPFDLGRTRAFKGHRATAVWALDLRPERDLHDREG